jgi:hypothetical protein
MDVNYLSIYPGPYTYSAVCTDEGLHVDTIEISSLDRRPGALLVIYRNWLQGALNIMSISHRPTKVLVPSFDYELPESAALFGEWIGITKLMASLARMETVTIEMTTEQREMLDLDVPVNDVCSNPGESLAAYLVFKAQGNQYQKN